MFAILPTPNRLALKVANNCQLSLRRMVALLYQANIPGQGSSIAQSLAYSLPSPAAPELIPGIPKKISSERIVDVAEVHQRCCLEESGQRLDYVNQTHLALASGKLVLQKKHSRHALCLTANQTSECQTKFQNYLTDWVSCQSRTRTNH